MMTALFTFTYIGKKAESNTYEFSKLIQLTIGQNSDELIIHARVTLKKKKRFFRREPICYDLIWQSFF